jgi:hypothetical protein
MGSGRIFRYMSDSADWSRSDALRAFTTTDGKGAYVVVATSCSGNGIECRATSHRHATRAGRLARGGSPLHPARELPQLRGRRQAVPMPSAVHPQGAGRHRGITTMFVDRSTIRLCPFHVSQADSLMRCSSSSCFPLRQAHVVILSQRAHSRIMYVFVCILTVC